MNDETPPRRPLVRTGARPLRLEPRMMFDGAAGPEALHLAGAAHGLAGSPAGAVRRNTTGHRSSAR